MTWSGGTTSTFPPPLLPYRPGDWVRFYRDGTPVIGVVLYVGSMDFRGIRLDTDLGSIYAEQVLEVRHG